MPGALDAWWTLHQRYGRLKWAEVLEPAIHLCESGVPVPQIIGFYIKRNLAAFVSPGSGVERPQTPCTLLRPVAQRRTKAMCFAIPTWRARIA